MRWRIHSDSTGGLPLPENSVTRNDVMKKTKTKAPARKAAKTARPSTKAKASVKATTRMLPKTPTKPATAKGKVARSTSVAKSSGKTAPRTAEKPSSTAPREALTLPPKPAPVTAPIPASTAASPPAVPPKPVGGPPRADVPPQTGFTLLVDGHFKNQFETLAQAKHAATDLKSRFPMLRIAIYDAATKTRLPV